MPTYAIIYDLHKSQHCYESFFEAIKAEFPTHWRGLDCSWLVSSEQSAEEILDSLRPRIDADDMLLVIRLTNEAAWAGLTESCEQWIRRYL